MASNSQIELISLCIPVKNQTQAANLYRISVAKVLLSFDATKVPIIFVDEFNVGDRTHFNYNWTRKEQNTGVLLK